MYSARVINSSEEFFLLEEKWDNLLSHSSSNNYFLRWEWLWNWWEVFKAENRELYILLIEKENGELVGIAPFYLSGRCLGGIYPVRRLMFLGTQTEGGGAVGSEYMNIISKKGEEAAIAEYILEYIIMHKVCDEIYLSKMDTSCTSFVQIKKIASREGIFTLVDNKSISPYIKLPSSWDEYLSGLSSSVRYRIRKERRRHENSSKITIRKTRDKIELANDFEDFIRLHQARWVSRQMPGAFSNDKFTLFHKKIVNSLIKNGQLDLIFLSVDGRSKAAMYNIVYNNIIYFYSSGLDIGDTKGALGLLLHSHCIEEAICKGMDEYDFMLKGKLDDYKDQWTNTHRTLADLYLASTGIAKHYTIAQEFARLCYRRVKPFIVRNSEKI